MTFHVPDAVFPTTCVGVGVGVRVYVKTSAGDLFLISLNTVMIKKRNTNPFLHVVCVRLTKNVYILSLNLNMDYAAVCYTVTAVILRRNVFL